MVFEVFLECYRGVLCDCCIFSSKVTILFVILSRSSVLDLCLRHRPRFSAFFFAATYVIVSAYIRYRILHILCDVL